MVVIVFRNRLQPGVDDEYGVHASRVYELAERMPGFVASKDFSADDGERCTVIEFSGAAELAAWRYQTEHREAQAEGRRRYYEQYSLQVCELVRESRFAAPPVAPVSDSPEALAEPVAPSPQATVVGSASRSYEGGCFCGAIRYRASGTLEEPSICHCSICRRTSGAPLVAWATFPTQRIEWLKGEPRRFASSAKAERSFCAQCGCALTFTLIESPERTDVTLASLDHPEQIAPLDHIHTSSRIPWVRIADGLPSFSDERPSTDT